MPSCSFGSRFALIFGFKMLLGFSGGTVNPGAAVVGGPPIPPAGAPAPPTGPPAPYPLLDGRFWFSPLADWVSNQSIQLFRRIFRDRVQRCIEMGWGGEAGEKNWGLCAARVYLLRGISTGRSSTPLHSSRTQGKS